jgi:DNA-binding NarL/FixJ family response regulator
VRLGAIVDVARAAPDHDVVTTAAARPARILVADDHEVVRRGLRALIEAAGHEVCAEAGTGRGAVDEAERTSPHVAVLDVSMPELNGFEAARRILAARPSTAVLIVTAHDSEQIVRDVLSAGARGYVLKSDAAREVVAAIEDLLVGRQHFTSKVAEMVLAGYLGGGAAATSSAPPPAAPDAGEPSATAASPTSRLTPREREVLQLLAEGKSAKEIAAALTLSVKTVETHRANLMRSLGLDSISDLVRYAVRNRIIEP